MLNDEILKKYINLKKTDHKNQQNIWTIENIKDGFEYFKDINGRYPTRVIDINNFEYLPSVKTIERSFGGMVRLRETLKLDIPLDFTKGETRSLVAGEAFKRSQKYEKDFLDILTTKIPEIRIHEHKIIRPGNTASDFFIYTSNNSGIMIDVFYAMDVRSLAGIIRIKALKCLDIKLPIYFVLVNDNDINQEELDYLKEHKKIELPENITIITKTNFLNKIVPSIKLEPITC